MNSLRDICDYVVTRTNIIENYISTENMLPNKGGVCDTLKVPSGGIGTKYQVGDILISNIRPYYKKIWQADCEGACSTDVLCLRANENVDSRFLYYLLTQQSFFDYVMSGTKGCKMPRGDKQQIMHWPIHLPSLVEQKKIAGVLSVLDAKIQVNRSINDNLEQQAQALYKSWFVDFEPFKNGDFVESELGLIPIGWKVTELSAVTKQITGKVKDRTDVKVLSPVNSGELVLSEEYFTKQVFSESISKYIVVKPLHFAYNPARVNIGSIGMNTFAFDGCVSPVYVVFECEKEYHHFFDYYRKTDSFKDEVLKRAIGGVRQTLSYKDFSLIKLVYPPLDVVKEFNAIYERLLDSINRTKSEDSKLSDLRDTLLPKLMSGELKINEIDC